MSYVVMHRMGNDERDFPLEHLDRLLDELVDDDPEHASVALRHESEWTLSVGRSGLLVWENVEVGAPPPRHMKAVPRHEVLRLWRALAQGDLAEVERAPWLPGYG